MCIDPPCLLACLLAVAQLSVLCTSIERPAAGGAVIFLRRCINALRSTSLSGVGSVLCPCCIERASSWDIALGPLSGAFCGCLRLCTTTGVSSMLELQYMLAVWCIQCSQRRIMASTFACMPSKQWEAVDGKAKFFLCPRQRAHHF